MAIEMYKPENGDSKDMRPFRCVVCGYVYGPKVGDPENNVPPGTPFSDLPDDWLCPLCGAGKSLFTAVEE